MTYVASTAVCGYSYHEIYQVTVRQSKKKRALNSSSLRLHDDSADVPEPIRNTRRTPRERKRNNNKKCQNSATPSRSASIRSIASITSFSMKSWNTGLIDIQRTRRTLMVTMLVCLLPAPLYFWGNGFGNIVLKSKKENVHKKVQKKVQKKKKIKTKSSNKVVNKRKSKKFK